LKIVDEDFNRDLSKYINERRTKDKPIHLQISEFIKQTRKTMSSLTKPKKDDYQDFNKDEDEAVEIEVEKPEKLVEEYEELDSMEEDIKEKKKSFWSFFTDAFKLNLGDEEDLDNAELTEEAKELIEENDELKEDYEELEDLEEDVEEEKEGILQKLMSFFSTSKEEPEIIEEVRDEFSLNDDIKDAFRFLTKWIEKLPEKELKKFKESEDFEKYKQVLRKYNMIK
jgi:hypothetical protein